MKTIIKNSILFLIFGTIYFIIETIWKGHLTHWSMFILGGICGLIIGGINEFFPESLNFWAQCLIGLAATTILEGITGFIVNIVLKWNIWDYSNVPFNFFFHQCSIPFCLAWFILSGVCIVLDDWLRLKFFNEKMPKYIFSSGKK